jgi:hypothetical protein
MNIDNYVVMAYRWGHKNAHSYIVTSGTDLDAMILAAEEECGDRGGKYGVSVIRTNQDFRLNISHEEIRYFPSLFGEEAPFYQQMIDVEESIGRMVIEAVETGKTYLRPIDGSSVMRNESVEVPEWLANEVRSRIVQESS